MRRFFLPLIFALAACAAPTAQPASGAPSAAASPAPNATPSPTFTPNVLIILETPIPTSTPSIHIVQAGDTFSELAEQFKISQDALRAANPDVKPNSMSIGQTLLIPDPASAMPSGATPTPEPVPVTQTVCHPTADGGLWCFALLQNSAPHFLENIAAQITLLDSQHESIASQSAFLPLDALPPNASLPAYAFFPNAPADATMQVQILSAIPSDGTGILPARVSKLIAQIHWSGLTASVSGEITLPPESKAATQTRIAATAYDQGGQVVGLKEWEGGTMQPGEKAVFNFQVSSLGAAIDRVECVTEIK